MADIAQWRPAPQPPHIVTARVPYCMHRLLHLTAMRHSSLSLRLVAAAWLLLACGGAFGASPAQVSDDEAIAALQAAYARRVAPGEQADLHRELLAAVLQRVKRSHATEVDLPALAAAAAEAMEALQTPDGEPAAVFKKAVNEALRILDPHSRYLDARAHENERAGTSGSFGGLGLEVQAAEGAVRVVARIPGSPGERAGLTPGDLIVRVDDQPLDGVALADAIALMRGQPGTPVSVTVRRPGIPNEFTVSLTRDTIRRQVLRWSIEREVLVLRLASFSGAASESLAQAVADATAGSQPRAVVLDLRGNPGGLLREAVRVADAFLDKGEIVSIRGSTPTRQRGWQADGEQVLAGLPMAVLIDGRSASASELVADALRQNGRATVMGQRSLGKGSVQSTFALGERRGALKLTTSLYYGPSGQTLHRTGVAPDIELLPSAAGQPAAHAARARVDAGRCGALAGNDPGLSCAVQYLLAGGIDAFVAGLAD